MLEKLTSFWHHLLNPHCIQCTQDEMEREELERVRVEKEYERLKESQVCDTCEVLRQELAIAHQDYRELLKRLTERAPEITSQPPSEITIPKVMPWKVKQQMLEKEDRIKAELLRKRAEEMEREVIGTNNAS